MADHAKLVAAAALAFSVAHASASDWGSQFIREHPTSLRGTGSLGGVGGATIINSGDGGALIRARQVLDVGGARGTLTLTRPVTLANIAKVGARAAMRFGPLGIASLGLEGLIWVGDEWRKDQEPKFGDGYVWAHTLTGGSGACRSPSFCSFEAMRDEALATFDISTIVRNPTFVGVRGSLPGWGQMDITYERLSGGIWGPAQAGTIEITSKTGAPVVPETVPATDKDLESAIEAALSKPAQYGKAAGVLDSAVNSTGSTEGVAPGPTSIDGPTSLDGGTTTTTGSGPSGTPTGTTTTTTTHDIGYSSGGATTGPGVTVTTRRETTHPDGSTTTETEGAPDNPEPDDIPADEVPPGPGQQIGVCEKYPDILACQKLGTIEAQELPKRTIPLAMAPEEGFGEAAVASCPADVGFSWQGVPLGMSWQPFCQLATGIRPIVIAMAYLSALFGFFSFARRD